MTRPFPLWRTNARAAKLLVPRVVPTTLLKLPVICYQPVRIMADGRRNPVADLAHGFNDGIVFHYGATSPRSSKGATNVGANKPSIPLTRRICTKFMAEKVALMHRCNG